MACGEPDPRLTRAQGHPRASSPRSETKTQPAPRSDGQGGGESTPVQRSAPASSTRRDAFPSWVDANRAPGGLHVASRPGRQSQDPTLTTWATWPLHITVSDWNAKVHTDLKNNIF